MGKAKDKQIQGGCHCGAVRYTLAKKPTASMICHCRTCRGVSGSPILAWISVARDDLAFSMGHAKEYVSSEGVLRQFCGRCGTQLTYARTDDEEEIDITTASLDDPNAFPPTHHSWLKHDLDWIKFGDGLPTYNKSRTD
jgi:hypothetical protein